MALGTRPWRSCFRDFVSTKTDRAVRTNQVKNKKPGLNRQGQGERAGGKASRRAGLEVLMTVRQHRKQISERNFRHFESVTEFISRM